LVCYWYLSASLRLKVQPNSSSSLILLLSLVLPLLSDRAVPGSSRDFARKDEELSYCAGTLQGSSAIIQATAHEPREQWRQCCCQCGCLDCYCRSAFFDEQVCIRRGLPSDGGYSVPRGLLNAQLPAGDHHHESRPQDVRTHAIRQVRQTYHDRIQTEEQLLPAAKRPRQRSSGIIQALQSVIDKCLERVFLHRSTSIRLTSGRLQYLYPIT
jgi:hypothetical protein